VLKFSFPPYFFVLSKHLLSLTRILKSFVTLTFIFNKPRIKKGDAAYPWVTHGGSQVKGYTERITKC